MLERDANYHLLFAVLALQNRFVTRDQLIEVLNLWSIDKSRSLEQILADNQLVASEDRQLLQRMAERQLEIHGSIAESLSQFSATFDLIDTGRTIDDETGEMEEASPSINDFELREAIIKMLMDSESVAIDRTSAFQHHGSSIVSPTSRPGGFAQQNQSRFEVVSSHAKGGLGEVFLARDNDLARDVALKEIQTRFVRDPVARHRFEFEACVTGGLEHPGVVPVYAYGHYDNGSPYYAMRFIRGQSMKEQIDEYHKLPIDPTQADHQRSVLRALLSRFIDTCNAIAYAHSRGVIHRDIKPANIMLGKFGETLVVDWGLAKSVGRNDQSHPNPAAEDTLRPLSGSDGSATQEGSSLGTPAFMSPEQAAGKLDEMGAASDIFSLGATLYNILTGRPPFTGKNPREVVSKAVVNEYDAPLKVLPTVPRPLNAIVVKAMSTSPGSRYQTALELASDVEAFLSDDPVSAYQENFWEQSQRWLKRHRTLATAGFVLMATLGIGLAISNLLINIEKKRTENALNQAEIALEAETQARRQTREMLDTVTDNVIGEMMARQLELTDSDRQFFDRVLNQFEQFTTSLGSGAEADNLKADGFLRVGNLQSSLGQIDAAIDTYQQAIDLWQKLIANDPENLNYQRDLAAAQSNLALKLERQDDQQAIVLYSSAADLLKGVLASLSPEEVPVSTGTQPVRSDVKPRATRELARIYSNWANTLVRLDRKDEAEERYRLALQGFETLKENDEITRAIQDHARVLGNYAALLLQQPDRLADAQTMIEEAIAILAEPAEDGKTVPPNQRFDLAIHTRNLGQLLVARGEPEQAAEQLREGARVLSQLAEEFPALTVYRNELATFRNELFVAENNLANSMRQAEQYDLAIPIYQRQLQILDAQIDRKDDPEYSEKLATTLYYYGESLVQAKNFDVALSIWTRLCEFRKDPNWQVFEIYRAMCLIRTGKADQGLEAVEGVATASDLMPFQWINFACCYAVAAEMHPDDEQRVEQYRVEAMKYLRKGAESGFFETPEDAALLAGDSDLNSLKNYPPFIEYCKEYGIPLGEIQNN